MQPPTCLSVPRALAALMTLGVLPLLDAREPPTRAVPDEPRAAAPATEKPDSPPPPERPAHGVALHVETLSGLEPLFGDTIPPLSLEDDADNGLELRAGDRSFTVGDLLFLSFTPVPSGPRGPVQLRLLGDDMLWVRVRERTDDVDEDSVRVESPAFAAKGALPGPGSRDLNLEHVRRFLFRDAFESIGALRTFEARLRKSDSKGSLETDVLHLKSGDPIEGFLDDLGEKSVAFAADGLGDLDLALEKVKAVALSQETGAPQKTTDKPGRPDEPASGSPRGPSVRVYLQDGGLLSGRLESLSSASLTLRHARLRDVVLRLSEIAQIGFLGGRCQFLSDLDPVAHKEHLGAVFRRKMPFRRDANVLGGPLRVDGRTYPKGLGVHAYSRLEYDVAASFERFQATIALDETARPRGATGARGAAGAVVFRVYLDDEELFERSMTHDDAPAQVDLPIAAGRRLVLEVDFGKGDFQMALDRADWCSARVIKK